MTPPQIIISLRQGTLCEILCSNPTAEVLVVSWGPESADSAAISISKGGDTVHAHVQRAAVQLLHHRIGSDIEAALAVGESPDPVEVLMA